MTFGAPDLSKPPTAGSTTTLVLPMARDAIGLLPSKLMLGTRWDRLDVPATDPLAATGAPGSTPAPTPQAAPAPSPADDDPGTTAASAAQAIDLVTPEVPGEVVAPVAAKVVASGGLSVPVHVPAAPGLYRLVASIHQSDGLAFDAATQALLPALVVRVTGPRAAAYDAPTTANAQAGQPFALTVGVSNLGASTWGHPATQQTVGAAERVPASPAILVARWVSLTGAISGGTPGGGTAIAILPVGLAPGATATTVFSLTAPASPGDYLVVLDVVDPDAGSLASLGVPPGIVRVTVGT